MTQYSKKDLEPYFEVLRTHRDYLLSLVGVHSLAVGFKYIHGKKCADIIAVRVSVYSKKALSDLQKIQIIPSTLDGVPVDVVESNPVSHVHEVSSELGRIPHQRLCARCGSAYNPLQGGIQIESSGHPGYYGTLGCMLFDARTMDPRGLSNKHVMVSVGSSITQPAPADTDNNEIGICIKTGPNGEGSKFDCAVCSLNESRGLSSEIIDIEISGISTGLTGYTSPELNMPVMKSGVRTGTTYGLIDSLTDSSYFSIVPDSAFPTYEISAPGDSGSVWVESATNFAVGLHNAGEGERNTHDEAYAIEIDYVQNELNLILERADGVVASVITDVYSEVSANGHIIDVFVLDESRMIWHILISQSGEGAVQSEWTKIGNGPSGLACVAGLAVAVPEQEGFQGSTNFPRWLFTLNQYGNLCYLEYSNSGIVGDWVGLNDLIDGDYTSDPSAITDAYGDVHVFIRGAADSSLWHLWKGLYVASWEGPENLGTPVSGTPITSGPSAILENDSIKVYVRSDENQIFHRTFSSGVWQDWVLDEVAGLKLISSPAGAKNKIFGRSNTGTLGFSENGIWTDLGWVVTASPIATFNSEYTYIFYRGEDGYLWMSSALDSNSFLDPEVIEYNGSGFSLANPLTIPQVNTMQETQDTTFYTVSEKGGNTSKLGDNLNDQLSKAEYSRVTRVIGCGIAYGSGNSHGSVEFACSEDTSIKAGYIKVWTKAESNIVTLGSDLDNFVGSFDGTVKMLSIYYDKNNDKWRAIMVYSVTGSGLNYQAWGNSENKGSDQVKNVNEFTEGAAGVPAFGYAYGNNNNGVLIVKEVLI